jgi:hypothetical protein
VVSATQEVEMGRSQIEASLGKVRDTLSQNNKKQK